jgi:hypothetical protein
MYSAVIGKDFAEIVVIITWNMGADAKIKYIDLQFSKYCCFDDLVELKSKPMSCALRAIAMVGITIKRKSSKFQVTLRNPEKLQSHIKMKNKRKQLAKICNG